MVHRIVSRSRIQRQFKDLQGPSSGDSSVATSLVDALQKWADALEAQVRFCF
jgi:hypothetical protein